MGKSNLLKTMLGLVILLVGVIAWEAASSRPIASLLVRDPTALPGLTVTLAPIKSQVYQPNVVATEPPATTAATLVPSVTISEPNPIPALALPEEHFISNIRGHHQYFPLGCEAAAAKDWANYYKKDFNEFEFQYRLPVSDNPDDGFVGSVNAPWGQVPPYGYGVYAGPVADLLNAYGIQAKAYKGYTLEQVKAKIAQDNPVIAWVIGNVVGGVPFVYTDSKGNKVIVAAYEHVVIVTGYNKDHVRYMSNGKFYDTPDKVFLNSWGVLGNMVIVDN
jgi:uncharacterized protein YvpB